MISPGPASGWRSSQVALALALGGAVIAFVQGTRHAPKVPRPGRGDWRGAQPAHGTGDARVAPTYGELLVAQNGADVEVHALSFAAMHADRPGPLDEVVRDPVALASARDARASRRAFAGAPPVIPHPVAQRDYPSCLACHADGLRIDTRIAPAMSHRLIENCMQCHTTQQAAAPPPLRAASAEQPSSATIAGNSFEGAREGVGERAYLGAPPQMPHTTFMRETCASCHGVLGQGIRTTHPERANCLQCHAPVSEPDAQSPRMARTEPKP